MMRMFAESRKKSATNGKTSPQKNTLIIGAGDAGALVARELIKNQQHKLTGWIS